MKIDFWNKPKTQVEEEKWKELQKQGAKVPEWVANGTDIKEKGAWFRPDLEANFVGFAPTAGNATGIGPVQAGTWTNNVFAKSRNVADLRPEDIWGYADFVKKFGPSYMGGSEENRRAIAQAALNMGLVKEHHGTIDVNATPELMDVWNRLQGQGVAAKPPQGTNKPQSKNSQAKAPAKAPPKQPSIRPVAAPFQMPVMAPRPDYTTKRPTPQEYEAALASVRQQNTVVAPEQLWYNKIYS